MSKKQLYVPQNIYDIYTLFEKTKDIPWKENPFVFFKKIHGIPVKIAKNISNLNFYQIDIPINKKINPLYIIKYLKDIDYRNFYSSQTISFNIIKKIDDNNWIEKENYRGIEINYIVNYNQSKFYILFYNDNWFPDSIIISQIKYYHCFKILNTEDNYILRFEIVLNSMDIDQIVDIRIYLEMLINITRSMYNRFNIVFKLDHRLELETRQSIELRTRNRNSTSLIV